MYSLFKLGLEIITLHKDKTVSQSSLMFERTSVTCVYLYITDGQKRDHDEDDYNDGRKRQRGEGNRVDLRVLLQSKVCCLEVLTYLFHINTFSELVLPVVILNCSITS